MSSQKMFVPYVLMCLDIELASPEAEAENISSEDIITEILNTVEIP